MAFLPTDGMPRGIPAIYTDIAPSVAFDELEQQKADAVAACLGVRPNAPAASRDALMSLGVPSDGISVNPPSSYESVLGQEGAPAPHGQDVSDSPSDKGKRPRGTMFIREINSVFKDNCTGLQLASAFTEEHPMVADSIPDLLRKINPVGKITGKNALGADRPIRLAPCGNKKRFNCGNKVPLPCYRHSELSLPCIIGGTYMRVELVACFNTSACKRSYWKVKDPSMQYTCYFTNNQKGRCYCRAEVGDVECIAPEDKACKFRKCSSCPDCSDKKAGGPRARPTAAAPGGAPSSETMFPFLACPIRAGCDEMSWDAPRPFPAEATTIPPPPPVPMAEPHTIGLESFRDLFEDSEEMPQAAHAPADALDEFGRSLDHYDAGGMLPEEARSLRDIRAKIDMVLRTHFNLHPGQP